MPIHQTWFKRAMASNSPRIAVADRPQRCAIKYPLALLFLLCSFSFTAHARQTQDTLTPTQPINDTGYLVSKSGVFRLGFFNPRGGEIPFRYLGIWYDKIPLPTVVWVANRDNPLPETAGEGLLSLTSNGRLLLTNRNGTDVYWSSDINVSGTVSSPVARILDDGNLVVVDEGRGKAANYSSPAWQSFDYPTDTLLPGMKFGRDRRRGLDWKATAWKSQDDPSPGPYTIGLDVRGVPQLILRGPGSSPMWRTGPWNGQRFGGIPGMASYENMFDFKFVDNPDEVYYEYTTSNGSQLARVVVNSSGEVQRFVWNEGSRSWGGFFIGPDGQCDTVNPCGPFGVCNPNELDSCNCLPGFRPKAPQDWNLRNRLAGCERKTSLSCRNGTDGFLELRGAKLPDTVNATLVDKMIGLEQCKATCLKNCSCTAYAAANITGPESGCIIWTSDLSDIRTYAHGLGQELYVRLAAADLGSVKSKKQHWRVVVLVITLAVMLSAVGLLVCVGLTMRKRIKKRKIAQESETPQSSIIISEHHDMEGDRVSDTELPHFEQNTLVVATDYFSDPNKLGEGGFGPVYKGKLENGQEVAIKRLSRNSMQGNHEFRTEVSLIANLQHRNLVRLLGCCIQGEERMLVYEYMPNKSLDALLFDKEKGSLLNWNIRYQIIVGIARGILYLHQDSRFRIIHRDLKASNILLDKDLIPKISDFGMARIFGGDETEANTKKVVGTYGYMSPEYAMDGIFSIKSDVFSFGVLVLEIISGIKNKGVFHTPSPHNLLEHVWSFWNEGTILELVDKYIDGSFSELELLKCIQIGLLCVQEHPDDRPEMSSVILMLGSDVYLLPQPKRPGFMARGLYEVHSPSGRQDSCSANDISVTILDGR